MSKESETLRQRKKAQQDLLELKKIQQGEVDASSLRDDEKKIVPTTFDEKCENFFFYHKYKLIAIAAALIVLSIIITSMITTPNYDTTLTIYCHEFIDDRETSSAGEWLKVYFEDANNNGSLDILATDCSISPDTDLAETVRQRQLKIQSLLTDNEAMLFILDDDSLAYLNSIASSFTLFEEDNIVTLGDDFYKELRDGRKSLLPEKKHYLCLRSVDGSSIEKKAQEQYAAAKRALEKIKREQ